MTASASAAKRLHRHGPQVAFAVVAFLLASGVSARPMVFGARTLQLPDPDGFKAIALSEPGYMQVLQSYLPATNRLVDVYVEPAAAASMAANQPARLDHYFQLQVFRQLDGRVISPRDFGRAETEIQASMEDVAKKAREQIEQLTANGNAEAARKTSTDPKLALSGFNYLGTFRREPWGLFFAFRSHVSSATTPQGEDLVGSGAFVLVNYQALYLYSYSHYAGDADRLWVEHAVSAWADAVRAANPDDPALESQAVQLHGGVDWSTMFGKGVAWGLIAALVALVVGVMLKRRS